jgi:Putative prokaryotic signal transducing protein
MARQISVGTFPTRQEAETAQGLLDSAGILAWIASDDAGGAYPFDLSGGAHVLVDESDVEAATQVLADVADEV